MPPLDERESQSMGAAPAAAAAPPPAVVAADPGVCAAPSAAAPHTLERLLHFWGLRRRLQDAVREAAAAAAVSSLGCTYSRVPRLLLLPVADGAATTGLCLPREPSATSRAPACSPNLRTETIYKFLTNAAAYLPSTRMHSGVEKSPQ